MCFLHGLLVKDHIPPENSKTTREQNYRIFEGKYPRRLQSSSGEFRGTRAVSSTPTGVKTKFTNTDASCSSNHCHPLQNENQTKPKRRNPSSPIHLPPRQRNPREKRLARVSSSNVFQLPSSHRRDRPRDAILKSGSCANKRSANFMQVVVLPAPATATILKHWQHERRAKCLWPVNNCVSKENPLKTIHNVPTFPSKNELEA